MFEHISLVDHTRHSNGVYGKQVYRNAYFEMELIIGQTLDALREAGVLEDTTLVITSDHGQTPVEKLIAINTLLVRDGYIRLDAEGKLKDWDILFKSAAHSLQVYVKDPADKALVAKAGELLQRYAAEEDVGFEQIRTAEETEKEFRVQGDFIYSVEGADGYSFSNALSGELINRADNTNYKYSVATHGHDPRKGPKPAMILKGPGIVPGARADGVSIIDEAPTLAALLGISLGQPDGKVISGILADEQ